MALPSPQTLSPTKIRGGHKVLHLQQWVMRPSGVDAIFGTLEELWRAAGNAEKRVDAVEARYFDISWPRCLSTDLMSQFVRSLFLPFIELGLVVQADYETSLGADGLPNDHIHAIISTRALTASGFADKKCRAVSDWFHMEGGKRARRHVAETFNELVISQGIDIRFDPASNAVRQLPPPEDRIPASYMRHPHTPAAQAMLARKDRQRALRAELRDVDAALLRATENVSRRQADLNAVKQDLIVIRPDTTPDSHAPVDTAALCDELRSLNLDGIGNVAVMRNGANFVPVGAGLVIDAGKNIAIEGGANANVGKIVSCLCRLLGWSGIQVSDGHEQPLALGDDWYAIDPEYEPARIEESRGRPVAELVVLTDFCRQLSTQKSAQNVLQRIALGRSGEARQVLEAFAHELWICTLRGVAPPQPAALFGLLNVFCENQLDPEGAKQLIFGVLATRLSEYADGGQKRRPYGAASALHMRRSEAVAMENLDNNADENADESVFGAFSL